MVRLDDILEKVKAYNPKADLDLIKKAYVFSAKVHKGQVRLSGEPYLVHPMEVAYILACMKLDDATITTGLLHDTVEDTYTTIEEIRDLFGEEIAFLVDGLTKISRFTFSSKAKQQAENFRKMLLAMAKDIRVVLIKLADRLHNMRTLAPFSDEKRLKMAQETLDIYAPLANRMGIGWIKSELEDLAFMYLEPAVYKDILDRIKEKKVERDRYIEEVKGIIDKRLRAYGLTGEVTGRPKHIYSIYRKMKEEGIDFDKVYDILGFRIIVGSIKECYEALGVIHSVWKPVPGRFKDYIAMPKANMYQSLHTTVVGPYGERIEIQIRTKEMHRVAEEGIAAHWMYKEGRIVEGREGKWVAWLRQLLEWQQDLKDPREFLESVKGDLFPEEVYVFTPKGDVKELPRGSTPVDFAYAIHTEIGHRCIGAKVNGKIVPLKYHLKNGDVVEIETSQNAHPSKDWLKFVKTSRARAKIRQWIRIEERDRSISLGRELCEREFKKYHLNLSIKSSELEKVAKEAFGLADTDSLFAEVGYGKISPHTILTKVLPPERFEKARPINRITEEGPIVVKGLNDLMVRIARCCNPIPGDSIEGFITKGRGISVHSAGCKNLLSSDPERRVEVRWGENINTVRPVKIEVICADEKGLLADMSSAIAKAEANISSAKIRTTVDKKAICIFEIQVKDIIHLNSIIKSLEKIKKVMSVERLGV